MKITVRTSVPVAGVHGVVEGDLGGGGGALQLQLLGPAVRRVRHLAPAGVNQHILILIIILIILILILILIIIIVILIIIIFIFIIIIFIIIIIIIIIIIVVIIVVRRIIIMR